MGMPVGSMSKCGGTGNLFDRMLLGRIDPAVPAFLAQAYSFKSVVDYGVGFEPAVTLAEAEQAIETAGRLIECIFDVVTSATRNSGA
jgi:hypothetical protein